MKKRISILTCIVLIFGMLLMSTTAFAINREDLLDESKFSVYGVNIPGSGVPGMIGITTRILADCDGGPHDMLSRGFGTIYNVDTGERVVWNGACWQCTKCYLVIITQGERGEPLGYYTSWQPHEETNLNGTVIYQSSKHIHYTTDTTLPGVKFRYWG